MKQIPLYKRSGGSNGHPETLRFRFVAWALVDDWWYDRLIAMGRWMYRKDERGVAYARLQRTSPHFKMHWVMGGKGWDHKDGDGLNNQESNLRPATISQQSANRALKKGSISGETGVGRDGDGWRVRVLKDGVLMFSKGFKDKNEAIKVAREKRREIHGEFVRS
jgi:hypothetical protein